MKFLERRKKVNELDRLIEELEREMYLIGPDGENYGIMADNLEKLYRAKSLIKTNKLSKDTIATCLISLAQIGLICNFERIHVLTSKALSFVRRGRG